MRGVVLIALFGYCAVVAAQETSRPTGKNCNLATPPEDAGEEMNHGITLRIYPRARDIDSSYSGCQVMWMPYQNNWEVVSVVAIASGDPIRIWSAHESDPTRLGCVYKKGKVVKGDAKNCAAPEYLIAKSLAPGCVAKISEAVAQRGIATRLPAGCEYE